MVPKRAPAKKAPVKKADAAEAPAESGSGYQIGIGTGKKAAAKKAPVKKAPAKNTPTKKAPAKKAPVKKAAAEAPDKSGSGNQIGLGTGKKAWAKKAAAMAATEVRDNVHRRVENILRIAIATGKKLTGP
jgi:ribose 5-phosphate isomerase